MQGSVSENEGFIVSNLISHECEARPSNPIMKIMIIHRLSMASERLYIRIYRNEQLNPLLLVRTNGINT